jgi:hypothetical protein
MSDPRVNYVSQGPGGITVECFDMPSGARLSLVNATSGASFGQTDCQSENGTQTVAVAGAPGGQYYVLAQDGSGERLAQTVPFYIAA